MTNKNPWKTISSKIVYRNRWLRLREDHVVRPDGKPGIYSVVEGKPFVCIVPKIGNMFYMVDQYRYPIQKQSIEFPMGGIESGESIEQALHRELQEESGLKSSQFTYLGFHYSANGHDTTGGHIYLAENCLEIAKKPEGSELDMVTQKFDEATLKKLIKDGTITDGPTVSAFCLYLLLKSD